MPDVIHGIWIFEAKDRDRIGKSMKKCRELSLIITPPPQLSPKTTITTSKNQKTSGKQVDIINLLKKAEIKENNDHYISTNAPLYNITTSNTIANAASSSSTTSSTFSYKPTSISNDRHSKDLLELFNTKTPPLPKRNIIDDPPRRYHTPPAMTNISTTPQNVLDGKLLLELLHQPTTTNPQSRSNSNSHSNFNHPLPLSSSSTSSSASSSLSITNGTTKLSSNPTISSTNAYFNYQQQRSLSPQNNNFSSMPVKSMLSSSIQHRNTSRAPGLSSAPSSSSTTTQSPTNHNNVIINNINYNPESLLTNIKNPNNLSNNKNIVINDSISSNNNNSSSSNDGLKRTLALDISIPTLNKFINEYDSNGINNIGKRILTKQEFVQQYLQLIQKDPSFMDILYQNYVVKFQNT